MSQNFEKILNNLLGECVLNRTFEPSEDFSDKPAFSPKSSWKHPPDHPGLELFLSQIERDIFGNPVKDSTPINSNMTRSRMP